MIKKKKENCGLLKRMEELSFRNCVKIGTFCLQLSGDELFNVGDIIFGFFFFFLERGRT